MNPFVIPKTPKSTHSIEEHSDEYFALFKPGEAMRSIFFHFYCTFTSISFFTLYFPSTIRSSALLQGFTSHLLEEEYWIKVVQFE